MEAASTHSWKNTALLLITLIPVSLGIVLLSDIFGVVVSVLVIGVIIFVSFFYISYRFPQYNITLILCCNFIVPLLIKMFRLYEIPFGIANEGLCAMMFITLSLNKRISGLKTLPGIVLCIWIFYEILELMNPYANSRVAGFYALRSLIPFLSSYYIMYSSVETKQDMIGFFKSWFVLGLLAGLYALYQEFFGLPSYDFAYATMDEVLYGLMFTWGRIRKFSFFFNPSEFGMLMSLTGVAAFIIFFFAKQTKVKVLCGVASLITLWSMLYTGSRTAMVMLPVGFFIFAAITLHRKALIAVVLIVLGGGIMIMRPSGGAMYVMSTAFSGADDPSMNVRLKNRELIRSYILTNPIGYGLGGTGALGNKFSPGTFIGTFATDSEYVRIAVEVGWLGLLLWCTLLAIVFGFGINVYFKTDDPEWRMILVTVLVSYFMVTISMYVQELFVSVVLPVLFSSMIAMMAKIYKKTTVKINPEADEE